MFEVKQTAYGGRSVKLHTVCHFSYSFCDSFFVFYNSGAHFSNSKKEISKTTTIKKQLDLMKKLRVTIYIWVTRQEWMKDVILNLTTD